MNKIIRYKQTEKEFKEMVQHIANVCAIPSISVADLTSQYPFGKEVDKVLDYVLNLSKSFGFQTHKDSKNRYGYAQIGNGETLIGILCHLDVVPSGDNSQWESEAFKPLIKENEIFGRGTLDDKGPTIITLYTLKYLLDNNLVNKKYSIRVIFGLSEETTMESMKFYLQDFGAPDLGYTPDGEWPIIFAEKLIFDYDLIFSQYDDFVLEAGEVYNQIPDALKLHSNRAKEIANYFDKKDVILKSDTELIIKGVAGHGSTPYAGDNAILKFVKAIVKNESQALKNDFFKFMFNNFQNSDFSMSNIFQNYRDDSGLLTSNPAFLRTSNGHVSIGFDMRVPATIKADQVQKDLLEFLDKNNYQCEFKMVGSKNAKYIPKDSWLIQTLIQTYRDLTDDKGAEPIAIGGGTYARTFENCVAFGATTKMELMHAPNEVFTYDEMKQDLEIYINALIRLQKD
ncbi:Sapep family Mn(2+)-dependent dipeptidase [Mycoplasma sp. 128]